MSAGNGVKKCYQHLSTPELRQELNTVLFQVIDDNLIQTQVDQMNCLINELIKELDHRNQHGHHASNTPSYDIRQILSLISPIPMNWFSRQTDDSTSYHSLESIILIFYSDYVDSICKEFLARNFSQQFRLHPSEIFVNDSLHFTVFCDECLTDVENLFRKLTNDSQVSSWWITSEYHAEALRKIKEGNRSSLRDNIEQRLYSYRETVFSGLGMESIFCGRVKISLFNCFKMADPDILFEDEPIHFKNRAIVFVIADKQSLDSILQYGCNQIRELLKYYNILFIHIKYSSKDIIDSSYLQKTLDSIPTGYFFEIDMRRDLEFQYRILKILLLLLPYREKAVSNFYIEL